jgi:hypothetical protein
MHAALSDDANTEDDKAENISHAAVHSAARQLSDQPIPHTRDNFAV